MKILRDSIVPIGRQLEDLLLEEMQTDKLKPGDRFYSELEITKKYSVSRSTVRNVYDRLVERHIITKRAGKGTYVSLPPAALSGSLLVGFTKKIVAMGVNPETKLIKCEVLGTVDEKVRTKLKIEEGIKVIMVKRARYVNQVPFVIHTAYLPFEKCKPVLNADLEKVSLTDFLENTLQLKIGFAEEIIYCFPAEQEDAKSLGIKAGFPILAVDGVSFDKTAVPIRYSLSKYRSDLVRLRSTNESNIKNV